MTAPDFDAARELAEWLLERLRLVSSSMLNLARAYLALEERLAKVEGQRDDARRQRDEIPEYVRAMRGVDSPCGACGGLGVRAYANTTTWRGGIGGQAITGGVCDSCWGSGDSERPWLDLRKAEAATRALEAERDALARKVERVEAVRDDVEGAAGESDALVGRDGRIAFGVCAEHLNRALTDEEQT